MRSLSPLQHFLLVAGLLYLAWFGGYEHYLAADGRLDAWLTSNLAHVSAAGLRGLGYPVTVSATAAPVLYLAQQPMLGIWHACNGLALYALFAGFILAFPGGPAGRKAWFIPAGLLLLYGLNVGRIMALCLNSYYAHQSVDFNHHYTFTVVVYAAIFGLWMIWATRVAPAPSPATPAHGFTHPIPA